MAAGTFRCSDCGDQFTLSEAVLKRYPNWTPRQCMRCREGGGSGRAARPQATSARPQAPSASRPAAMRNGHAVPDGDPQTGIFTDGSCQGNPGPGGWGAVWVENGQIIAEKQGFAPSTTNNRMELTAMIAGLEMAPADEAVTVWSDSQLVVNTLTKWAEGWEKRGWVRREGPVANVDLVQKAYALVKARPLARITWVPAHSGYTWNEYADRLSTAHVDSPR